MSFPTAATLQSLFPSDPDLFARVLWAEARSQGQSGMEAVASVVMNRAAHPRWWGRDLRGVLVQPMQFSCLLPEPTGQLGRMRTLFATDAVYRQAAGIVQRAMAGTLPDRTSGCDTYANLTICRPAWAEGKTPVTVIGAHSFFRLELKPGATVPPPQQLHAMPASGPAGAMARVVAPVGQGGQPGADALMREFNPGVA